VEKYIEGHTYPIGWVYERRHSTGGRSFGFVGGHFHDNFGIKAFRQAVVNGILWTAHVDVPEGGAPIAISRYAVIRSSSTWDQSRRDDTSSN